MATTATSRKFSRILQRTTTNILKSPYPASLAGDQNKKNIITNSRLPPHASFSFGKMFKSSFDSQQQGERKVFTPEEPLYYEKGKFKVFEATDKRLVKIFIVLNTAVCAFAAGKLGSKLLRLRIFGSIFWGGIFAISYIGSRNSLTYGYRYIDTIHLAESGQKVVITNLLKKSIEVAPHMIRKPEEAEMLQFRTSSLPNGIYPVVVRNELFVIEAKGRVENEQVFKAVLNGYEVENLKSKDDEDIIDI